MGRLIDFQFGTSKALEMRKLVKRKIRLKHLGSVLLLLICLTILVNTYQIYAYSFSYSEEPADVAIVLGAGSHAGKLSPVFRERVNHALDLYQRQKVSYILFTGGFGTGQNISDSQAAKAYALLKGVAEKHILLEEKSQVTWENLVEAKQLMQANQLKMALLVSDPLHMKRAMTMAEHLGIEVLSSPTPTSMYRSWDKKAQSLVYESFYYHLGILRRWF